MVYSQMQYLLRSTKQEELQLQRRWQSYFTLCGEKKPSLKNSRMRQLSTYSNGKAILISVIFIVASLYCQLLGRYLQEFYLTDRMSTLNSQGFYQKASVDSERTEEQLTWSSQQGSFKRNAGTEQGPLHDLCWPYQSIWYSQSWGSLKNYSKVWLSDQVHSNGEAVPRWYASTGPKWWWVFWAISCDKLRQARLCTSPISVRHNVLCHAHSYFPGRWQWFTY